MRAVVPSLSGPFLLSFLLLSWFALVCLLDLFWLSSSSLFRFVCGCFRSLFFLLMSLFLLVLVLCVTCVCCGRFGGSSFGGGGKERAGGAQITPQQPVAPKQTRPVAAISVMQWLAAQLIALLLAGTVRLNTTSSIKSKKATCVCHGVVWCLDGTNLT